MAKSFRERLTLDPDAGAWFDQTRRYMLLRPEALMGIFRRLPEAERAMALSALQDSVFEQGSDSARAYRAMGGTGEALLGVIQDSAPELGWGRWRFTREGEVLRLEVRNSPFAQGFGPSPRRSAPPSPAWSGPSRHSSSSGRRWRGRRNACRWDMTSAASRRCQRRARHDGRAGRAAQGARTRGRPYGRRHPRAQPSRTPPVAFRQRRWRCCCRAARRKSRQHCASATPMASRSARRAASPGSPAARIPPTARWRCHWSG